MPIKFGPTVKQWKRTATGGSITRWEYNYMKCKSKSDLLEAFNNERTKPKLRAKIRNDLVRRGGVVFSNKEEEDNG